MTQLTDQAKTSILEELNRRSSPELVGVLNRLTGANVKRFASKTDGLKRFAKLLDKEGLSAYDRLAAILAADSTSIAIVEADKKDAQPYDDGTPLEPIGEVLEKAVERVAVEFEERREAARVAERKAISDRARKKREAKGKTGKYKPPPKRKPGDPAVKKIDGSELVAVHGRIVRPENAERVLKGEVLCGKLAEEPGEKDRPKGVGAGVNLNYRPKPVIEPPREGSRRARLVLMLQRASGTTIEEVMSEFKLQAKAAIYMLRDVHYQCGYGIELKGGKVRISK